MSDVRISQLNAALPLSGNEYIPMTQIGTSGKLHTVYTTPENLTAYVIKRTTESVSSTPSEETHSTDALPIITPVGGVMPFAGDISNPNNIPTGWLVCDGTAYSKEQYKILYTIIGDKFGVASDSSLFKVPDLRYRVIMGYNNTTPTATPDFGNWSSADALSLGAAGGEFNHRLSVDETPSHNHSLTDPGHTHLSNAIGFPNPTINWQGEGGLAYNNSNNTRTAAATTGITIEAAGGNGYHTNMQPFICMNFIIKY